MPFSTFGEQALRTRARLNVIGAWRIRGSALKVGTRYRENIPNSFIGLSLV
ncbi:MAG: hypothetical protein ACI82G_002878, partial [Bradymonadia bacterium]